MKGRIYTIGKAKSGNTERLRLVIIGKVLEDADLKIGDYVYVEAVDSGRLEVRKIKPPQ